MPIIWVYINHDAKSAVLRPNTVQAQQNIEEFVNSGWFISF